MISMRSLLSRPSPSVCRRTQVPQIESLNILHIYLLNFCDFLSNQRQQIQQVLVAAIANVQELCVQLRSIELLVVHHLAPDVSVCSLANTTQHRTAVGQRLQDSLCSFVPGLLCTITRS